MKEIRQEVLKRITFARMLLNQGKNAILNKYDQLELTKGILLLHDAAEATLGAIADHLHTRLSGNPHNFFELLGMIML